MEPYPSTEPICACLCCAREIRARAVVRCCLAPSIRRISKRVEQQRHMIVRVARDPDGNRNLLVERFSMCFPEILADLEAQPIRTGREHAADLLDPPVFIRNAGPERRTVGALERHTDSHAGTAKCGIEDMRAERAHESFSVNSFSSRNRVIFRCSSAATRTSASGSFSNRARAIASISSALLPVAHTI